MSKNIMVVDDNADIRNVVVATFENEGWSAVGVSDGPTALKKLEDLRPDLVVLDILMPGMSGIDVCREIRQRSSVPIVFLSARDEDVDRIVGLEIGADDYVTKPFNPRELVARAKAIFRRTESSGNSVSKTEIGENVLVHGKLMLDVERFKAFWADEHIELTKTEFLLLRTLMRQPGRVFSRDELMKGAYDDGMFVSDRTIDSHIRRLRSKLAEIGADPIETVRGVGYTLGELA
ncbi:response regulator transcription factor [Microvenator marinus]|jgi:two-component system OmpR family response regulator|uniref:Response regulator transcription factor n=1 Tax=Microvenator marinus TaxID=2600177 RepID=A0A5B8XP98_9DELT|nr:response regulator transcription factor [Microvenator marinus]QED27354.1 response regulator transcription factor [Microvenator marinus]